jgi:hypothetical protein
MKTQLKAYEFSCTQGFDTLEQFYAFLEEIKSQVKAEAQKDGITENVLRESVSGNGWDVEIDYNDEITH